MDPVDYSGITVSLYSLAELDSTLLRINQTHPSIGVQITQETEFDHRLISPLRHTQSNADGSYEISGVSSGRYNLVFSCEQWGIVYRHNVSIGRRTEDRKQETVNLYPLQILTNPFYADYVFKKDHTYHIERDVHFNGHVTMEGGALIELGDGIKLILESSISKSGEGFTKFCGIIGDAGSSSYLWNSIELLSSGNEIRDIIICGSFTGLVLQGANNVVSNSIIRNSNQGCFLTGIGSRFSHTLIDNIADRALSLNLSEGQEQSSFQVDKSIIKSALIGIRTVGNAVRIVDNYFIDNGSAIFSNKNYHEIQYNNFDRNDRAVVCAGSDIPIKYNNFYDGNRRCISFAFEYYSSISNPLISQNNFYPKTGTVIYLYPGTTSCDVDARNNYWAGEDVPAQIWDHNDLDLIAHEVLYMPKLFTAVGTAGIRS